MQEMLQQAVPIEHSKQFPLNTVSSCHCAGLSICAMHDMVSALLNQETFILIQKRRPYNGNLNSGTSGDSKHAFLGCGDILGVLW